MNNWHFSDYAYRVFQSRNSKHVPNPSQYTDFFTQSVNRLNQQDKVISILCVLTLPRITYLLPRSCNQILYQCPHIPNIQIYQMVMGCFISTKVMPKMNKSAHEEFGPWNDRTASNEKSSCDPQEKSHTSIYVCSLHHMSGNK